MKNHTHSVLANMTFLKEKVDLKQKFQMNPLTRQKNTLFINSKLFCRFLVCSRI